MWGKARDLQLIGINDTDLEVYTLALDWESFRLGTHVEWLRGLGKNDLKSDRNSCDLWNDSPWVFLRQPVRLARNVA